MVPAQAIEDAVLGLLGLLRIPPHLHEQVIRDTERQWGALTQGTAPGVDRSAIAEQIKRLGRLFQDGLKTEREYERELAALRAQLDAATNDAVARFDVGRAIELVNDLPDLLASATAAERRAVLGSVIEKLWVADRELHAITPRAEWYPLMASIARCVHGVADGFRTRNPRNHNPMLCR